MSKDKPVPIWERVRRLEEEAAKLGDMVVYDLRNLEHRLEVLEEAMKIEDPAGKVRPAGSATEC